MAFYLNQPTEIDDTYPKYNPPNQSGKTSKIFGHVVWDNSELLEKEKWKVQGKVPIMKIIGRPV